MSSSNNNENNKNLLEKARESVHQTFETESDRQELRQGEKSAFQRALDKTADTVRPTYQYTESDDDNKNKNNNNDKKSEDSSGPGLLGKVTDGPRKAVYNATMSQEEKDLSRKADETVGQKLNEEVDDSIRGLAHTLEHARDRTKEAFTFTGKSSTNDGDGDNNQRDNRIDHSIDTIRDRANHTIETPDDDPPADKTPNDETMAVGEKAREKVDEFLEKAKETATGLFTHQEENEKETPEKNEQATSNEPSEAVLVDGMTKLGQTVQSKATKTKESIKDKFSSDTDKPDSRQQEVSQ